VIGLTGGVRVMVATRPVDLRKGAEGLAALVREEVKSDPFSGAVYVGTGVCLFAKRLEDGKFRWPNVQDSVSGCRPRNSRPCWKGLIGGGFTRRARRRRRRAKHFLRPRKFRSA
jgi:transposase